MEPEQCAETVKALLSSSARLLSARLFDVRVTAYSSGNEDADAAAHDDGSQVPTNSAPRLHIVCRDVKSFEQAPGGEQRVDQLGASANMSSRGFFEAEANGGGTEAHMDEQAPSSPSRKRKGPSLTLVADRVHNRSELEELLAHELQHALDHSVHRMDLASCGGLACSEIRAASIAECYGVVPSFLRRRCMRDKAWVSTEMVFPGVGGRCVDGVFEACRDSKPDEDPAAPGSKFHVLLEEERRQISLQAAQGGANGAATASSAQSNGSDALR
jgi:hypothetical protein